MAVEVRRVLKSATISFITPSAIYKSTATHPQVSPRGPCTLPYPEKFTAAVDFVERTPKGSNV